MKRAISTITGLIVFAITCAAFALSYDSLRNLAIDNGVPVALAWLWPLCLDAVVTAGALESLRRSFNGERAWYAWALVGCFTIASIGFNIVHSAGTLLSALVFAMPPTVVFLSIELLTQQLRDIVKVPAIQAATEAQPVNENDTRAIVLDYLLSNPSCTKSAPAQVAGVSATRSRAIVNALVAEGAITKNGKGWERISAA